MFEDEVLKALLDKDPLQTQEEFALSLRVAQQMISRCLKALEFIQKQPRLKDVERWFDGKL